MRPNGFSLAEVVISVALIAVAILSLVGVFLASMPLLAQNRELATAASLVRGLHEQIRACGGIPKTHQVYRGAAPDPAVAGFPPSPYPAVQVAGVDYTFQVTSAPVAGRTDLVTVTVEADWGKGHNLSQQCQYYEP